MNQYIFRLVTFFWLCGWYIKVIFFQEYLWVTAVEYPVSVGFFPAIMLSSGTSQFIYLLPLLSLGVFVINNQAYYRISSLVMIICAMGMCWHVNTYNDATFVTSFWVALWLFWLSMNLNRNDQGFRQHAQSLTLCIFALIFLGGAIGKLTPEYWNGTVFYNIYIDRNYHWPASWLKEILSPQDLKIIVLYFSRFVIFAELFFVLSPLLPPRIICFLGLIAMLSVSLLSTWRILSVMSCLIGLLLACWLWSRKTHNDAPRPVPANLKMG